MLPRPPLLRRSSRCLVFEGYIFFNNRNVSSEKSWLRGVARKLQSQQRKPQSTEAATHHPAVVREPEVHVPAADLEKQELAHAAHLQRKMLGSWPRIRALQGWEHLPERVKENGRHVTITNNTMEMIFWIFVVWVKGSGLGLGLHSHSRIVPKNRAILGLGPLFSPRQHKQTRTSAKQQPTTNKQKTTTNNQQTTNKQPTNNNQLLAMEHTEVTGPDLILQLLMRLSPASCRFLGRLRLSQNGYGDNSMNHCIIFWCIIFYCIGPWLPFLVYYSMAWYSYV